MTFDSLKEIILATVNAAEEKVAPDAKLIPDVCADSLDTVELAMALEDKTGVNVPDDVMPTFRTLGDLLAYLNEQGA
ncbi:MAG: acyl carrier protein [Clostridiales bacterium]|nr:acyl carrier protein [Clostridiales bacterium]